jgi:succinate dehydrogenase / fumarate reductase, flavoprotein subunit
MKQHSFEHQFKADVLIVGGGFSGMWAAIGARQYAENVLLLDKGPRDWGGLGTMSGGDFQCVVRGVTEVKDALDDVVYYHDGLTDQEMIEKILIQSYERFEHYERLGNIFVREENGQLKGIPQRGLKHMRMLLFRPYGEGGPNMNACLVRELNRLGVRRIGRMCVSDIITDKDSKAVTGAVGYHMQSGETFRCEAPAVVLATGAGGWKPSYLMSSSTGQGAYLGFKAGAALTQNEFLHIWNVPVMFGWEGQTGLLPLGAKFLNSDGEDFMAKYYSPVLGSNTDTTYNCRGMAFEARAGRTPIYFDTTPLSQEAAALMRPVRGWALINFNRLQREEGVKFFGEKTMWMPQIMWHGGGLATDTDCQTKIQGLYAACRCKATDPGVYMGGWALCTTAVTGYISGGAAAQLAMSKGQPAFDMDRAKAACETSMAPLGKTGFSPKDIMREIQEIIYPADVCLIKSEASLEKALERTLYVKNELAPRAAADDPRQLGKLHESLSMLQATELFARASLMRRESRAGHWREDFPQRNNDEWLKWIYAEKGQAGDVNLYTVPVPIERYKIKPHRYYMDNFTFPKS